MGIEKDGGAMGADRYAVIGNPVGHSMSPRIHAEFARQAGQRMEYGRILAEIGGFERAAEAFMREGGKGLSVTAPFKEAAFAFARERTARAEEAGAANALRFEEGKALGDNADGAGLARDLTENLGFALEGKRILLLGAGGAARGALGALLAAGAEEVAIANRDEGKARRLAERFGARARGVGYAGLKGKRFGLAIRATPASWSGEMPEMPELPEGLLEEGGLAYDLAYGAETPFMAWARKRGAEASDGLGMLVEQAAESFWWWRGERPETKGLIRDLRREAGGRRGEGPGM